MPAYPTLDHLDDLTPTEMDWARQLDFMRVTDPGLSEFYAYTARFSTVDPNASLDDIFVFYGYAGMDYTVQSGSSRDPFLLRIHDDLGNAIAADDGSGAYGYDYASFVAPYSGWYYVNASWDQAGYDSYASVNVYEGHARATNTMSGTGEHDMLYGTRADDIVDGGAGVDTFVLEGLREEYAVTVRDGVVTVVDLLGVEGLDTLRNVERLSFDGGDYISYETSGYPAEAYRLYQAAFDRSPDEAGLGFWIGQMSQGASLHQVAQAFVDSPEFRTLYGPAPSHADIVTAFYANVLDRAPDADGFAFWMGALDSGMADVASVLTGFSESGENQAQLLGVMQAGYEFTLA